MSAAHLRLSGVFIERLHWAELIERYDRPHTFFYLDPPYWQTAGYGGEFGWEEYERIAGLLKTAKGSVIVSLNDHPDILSLFKGWGCKLVDYTYTAGGSHNAKPVREAIFYNKPVAKHLRN